MDRLKNWIQLNRDKMDIDEPNAATWNGVEKSLLNPVENDLLKNHIAVNKGKLDIETPHAQAWEEISSLITVKEQVPRRRIKRGPIYLSAACIITIISLGVFRYMNVVRTDREVKPGAEVPMLTIIVPATDIKKDTSQIHSDKDHVTATAPSRHRSSKWVTKSKRTAVAFSKPLNKEKGAAIPPEVLQLQKDYGELIAGQIIHIKQLVVYGENVDYFERFMNDFKLLDKKEKELRMSIAQHGLEQDSMDNLAMLYQQKLTVLKKLQNEINKTSTRNKNITDTIPAYIEL